MELFAIPGQIENSTPGSGVARQETPAKPTDQGGGTGERPGVHLQVMISSLPRRVAVLALLLGALFASMPGRVCGTERCPMDTVARQACQKMGGDCCPGATRAERAPSAPAPTLAALPSAPAVPVPARSEPTFAVGSWRPVNASTLHPEIGRFTLFAAFLI